MSGSSNKSQNGSPKILRASGTGRGAAIHQINPMTSPALEGTSFISPRTPRGGRYSFDRTSDDDVELRLLGEDDQRRAANGIDDTPYYKGEPKRISSRDKRNMVLLCVLYLIQGVPTGLALGSVPFLLKEKLTYSAIATFSLSSYPYSLKLLWSPIVDSLFFPSIGRRKSWIIPMQLIVGTVMLYISLNVDTLLENPASHINQLTFLFTLLVVLAATQDIAVDGWALTLLSQDCLSYASTCQTIGLNTGFFASFTVFLALNSESFCEKWGIPRLTLGAYLTFWAFVCYLVTIWLTFFKKEDPEPLTEADLSIMGVYKQIWEVCKLKHVQMIIVMHMFAKLGFAANEAATSLKMVDKGFQKEDLAVTVLIDFPCQIFGGWLAAKWSRGDKPLRPWIWAFWPRLGFCLLSTIVVYYFPPQPLSMAFFGFLVVTTVLSSFTSTIQFVGISAFHTRVSDPLIGGTYMTLLNTFTNMGGTWPKWFVLKGVDLFSVATCSLPSGSNLILETTSCASDHGKEVCKAAKGDCIYETDGYYIVSGVCMAFGVVFLIAYIIPTAKKLQALPLTAWRIKL
ncbi:acetyl-coenzyme A transporter 1-domain-containing protein [Flagelloscypha sp. PMI_526]|nr:acetyl-coenzyme A transporter 1-domain-containing protein [Flagelloscypha sp. PMI_526]